jgi:branched-chain amino acid aminotransferase
MATTAFGTVLASTMAICELTPSAPPAPRLVPVGPLPLHPAAHALHYGSACFEGLKAHRGTDGRVRLFRPQAHAQRLRRSAELLCLPVPDADLVTGLLHDVVAANLDEVPEPPGALYLRPVLLGTDPNIGAAAVPSEQALLYVLASPVGDYFAGGGRRLRLLVETALPRTTPQFGQAKAGANYVMAMGQLQRARAEHAADQVLFAPDGIVQETGAANVLLLGDDTVVTPALDGSFLHGVTRDSVLELARHLGSSVEERTVKVDELLEAGSDREMALSGTAAVLAEVGTIVVDGREHRMGADRDGRAAGRLRAALLEVQRGEREDRWGWTVPVE